jgi:hypothetical protein
MDVGHHDRPSRQIPEIVNTWSAEPDANITSDWGQLPAPNASLDWEEIPAQPVNSSEWGQVPSNPIEKAGLSSQPKRNTKTREIKQVESKVQTITTIENTIVQTSSNSQPKGKSSWAQLVKGPDPIPVPKIEKKIEVVASAPASIPSSSPVKKIMSLPSSPKKPAQELENNVEEKVFAPPGLKNNQKPASAAKSVKQSSPVVMPPSASLASAGVQFGSLKISNPGDLPIQPSPSFGST